MAEPEALKVRARVALLPQEQGGRSRPLVGGTSYRPNHNFFGPENRDMAMGLIDLPVGTSFSPGETKEMDITFFPRPELRAEISPGRQWLIQEGGQVVGSGTVITVVE